MRGKPVFLPIAFTLALTGAAVAQSGKICVVNDPSPTPLNVRDRPYGRIVGALHNGTHVYRVRTRTDYQGDDWSYIVPLEGGRAGWVFRNYVTCAFD